MKKFHLRLTVIFCPEHKNIFNQAFQEHGIDPKYIVEAQHLAEHCTRCSWKTEIGQNSKKR